MACGCVDWIGVAQDTDMWKAFVNTLMNILVRGNAGKLSSGCTTGGLPSSTQPYIVG
jgi:hypothetical protein